MARLGQYLISRGLVTGEQLDDALASQAVQGARLGTNLVELGALSIEDLAQALADYHKAPLPPREWLDKPQRTATQRVTRALVERIRFIPMRLEGKVLHAALLDPRHPNVLDDLRFATGFRIEPYVLPEIWMHDWLLELFNVPRGIRHVEARERTEREPEPVAELNAHRPDAPPNFETTAMTNALSAAAAAVADARRMARNRQRPGPEARTGSKPRPAVQPRVATAPTQPTQAAQPTPRASAPTPQPRSSSPSMAPPPSSSKAPPPPRPPSSSKAPPPLPPAASVRPPSMRVRGHAPLSAIEAETWTLPRQRAVVMHDAPTEPVELLAERAPSPIPFAPEPEPEPAAAALPAAAELAAVPVAQPTAEPSPAADALQPAAEAAVPATTPTLEPLSTARELSHWESALAQVTDRERLIEVAFSIASCFAPRVALFSVNQGSVQGVRQCERGQSRPVEGVVLPLAAACMLSEAATRAEPTRTDARVRPADQHVLALLQDPDATEVALFPVAIKKRVVNVLYASNPGEPLGPIAFGALSLLAQEMGLAYGRLILMRKTGGA